MYIRDPFDSIPVLPSAVREGRNGLIRESGEWSKGGGVGRVREVRRGGRSAEGEGPSRGFDTPPSSELQKPWVDPDDLALWYSLSGYLFLVLPLSLCLSSVLLFPFLSVPSLLSL